VGGKRGPVAERFWPKVNKDGPVPQHRPDLGPCWLWTAATDRDGYGRFNIGGRVIRAAHQVAYSLCVGPVPPGLELDHLCRVHGCVNPDHLEPVTTKENGRRGYGAPGIRARQTACIHGHPFDEANTYRAPNGTRACRRCRADTEQRRRAAKR
jgi:hypothetical protein